jgi:hypothetical protein
MFQLAFFQGNPDQCFSPQKFVFFFFFFLKKNGRFLEFIFHYKFGILVKFWKFLYKKKDITKLEKKQKP